MRTSVADVFAAGDVCTAAWTHSPYWLQVLGTVTFCFRCGCGIRYSVVSDLVNQ